MADFAASTNLTTMTAAEGVTMNGQQQFDQVGLSVAAACDVNGDGLTDNTGAQILTDQGRFNGFSAFAKKFSQRLRLASKEIIKN